METDEIAVSHWEEIVLKGGTFTIAVLIYHWVRGKMELGGTQIVLVLGVLLGKGLL